MKIQSKGAVLVQIAPLFISRPRNQNQSIGLVSSKLRNVACKCLATLRNDHTAYCIWSVIRPHSPISI